MSRSRSLYGKLKQTATPEWSKEFPCAARGGADIGHSADSHHRAETLFEARLQRNGVKASCLRRSQQAAPPLLLTGGKKVTLTFSKKLLIWWKVFDLSGCYLVVAQTSDRSYVRENPSMVPDTRNSLILRLSDSRDIEAWDQFVSIYDPLVYRFKNWN